MKWLYEFSSCLYAYFIGRPSNFFFKFLSAAVCLWAVLIGWLPVWLVKKGELQCLPHSDNEHSIRYRLDYLAIMSAALASCILGTVPAWLWFTADCADDSDCSYWASKERWWCEWFVPKAASLLVACCQVWTCIALEVLHRGYPGDLLLLLGWENQYFGKSV